jgi:hypothetical protein
MIAFFTFINNLLPFFSRVIEQIRQYQEQSKLDKARIDGYNKAKIDEVIESQKTNVKVKEIETIINEVEPPRHNDYRDRLRNGEF